MRWSCLPLCSEMQCHFKRPQFKDAIRANHDINLKCKNFKVLPTTLCIHDCKKICQSKQFMQLGFMNTDSHFNAKIATSGNSFVAMQIF